MTCSDEMYSCQVRLFCSRTGSATAIRHARYAPFFLTPFHILHGRRELSDGHKSYLLKKVFRTFNTKNR